MANYLVTGGCGFIGSHLVDSLLAAGHRVRVLDDLSTGYRANLDVRAELIVGDVCDSEAVVDAMTDVDGCFHLAAIASVERSVKEWKRTHKVNLSAAINIFDAAKNKRGVPGIPVVYASSAAVYGDNASVPLSEHETLRPLTAYGADKLGCELHGRVAALVHNVPNVGFRFFNVFGPRQDPKSPYSGVISIFIDRLLRDEVVSFFGDGEQCRDFVYVLDVVAALTRGMHWLEADPNHRTDVFNVCTGRITSINQLARAIAGVLRKTLNFDRLAPRSGDIRLSLGDSKKARQRLGFTAETELSDGLNATIAHLINVKSDAA